MVPSSKVEKKGMCKKGHGLRRALGDQRQVEWITPRKGPSNLRSSTVHERYLSALRYDAASRNWDSRERSRSGGYSHFFLACAVKKAARLRKRN